VSPRQVWNSSLVGGRWVGSHKPVGGGLSLRQSSGLWEHGPGVPEGHGPSRVEIVHACGSPA
jgi:hypothetical protein